MKTFGDLQLKCIAIQINLADLKQQRPLAML